MIFLTKNPNLKKILGGKGGGGLGVGARVSEYFLLSI